MIEVNLIPGGKKKRSRGGGGFSLSLPSFGGAGFLSDKWVLGAVATAVVAIGGIAFLWQSTASAQEEMTLRLENAVRDSARFSAVRTQTELLRSRSDSIVQRVAVIQEIDVGRYVWPHIMDAVSSALPAYTWLTGITWVSGTATDVQLRINGGAGNNIALATFMDELESSEFLMNVELIRTSQNVDNETGQTLFAFEVEVRYEQPPLELLETVPLFSSDLPAAPEILPDTVG